MPYFPADDNGGPDYSKAPWPTYRPETGHVVEGNPTDLRAYLQNHLLVIQTQFRVLPDWAGFRQWRYSNADYMELMRSHPAEGFMLENAIARDDFDSAGLVWAGLVSRGNVSAELASALAEAAVAYNLPDAISAALLPTSS